MLSPTPSYAMHAPKISQTNKYSRPSYAKPHPAANVLFALNVSPYFHSRIGAGHPNPIAINASSELPHP